MLGVAAAACLTALTTAARAQERAAVPADQTAATDSGARAPLLPSAMPPDVVWLKNGGMLRGTIIELVPGEFTVIQLPTGETRKIPMRDVESVGPLTPEVRGEDVRQEPFITYPSRRARLHVVSSQRDVTVLARSGELTVRGISYSLSHPGSMSTWGAYSISYERICTAPCEVSIPTGTYQLALAQGSGPPVESDGPVTITGPSTLHGIYTSRHGLRLLGWGLIVSSLAVESYLIFDSAGLRTTCHDGYCGATTGDQKQTVGLIMVGAGILGTILTFQRDHVSILAIPGTVPVPQLREGPSPGAGVDRRETGSFDIRGLTIGARF